MSLHPQTRAAAQTQTIDVGLQAFMQKVYRLMGLGLGVTGLTAFAVSSTPALMSLLFGNGIVSMIVIFSPLAFVLLGFTPNRIARLQPAQLQMMFVGFSVLMGLSMSTVFMVYTGESIARTFFITAATFAAVSLYGYTTKRDLTGMGGFMSIGLIGLVIASVVNIFLGSPMVQFVISSIGVLVFAGLAAWETQRLKETYAWGQSSLEAQSKLAIMGALGLYMSFVNLFQSLLYFMGNRE